MYSTSSAELAPSVSALSGPECEPSHSARSHRTAEPCSPSDGPASPAMATSANLQPSGLPQMELPLMSSAAASLAKTSALPARARVSKEAEAGSGLNTPVSLASYDHSSSLWKTLQRCCEEEWAEFSGTWPPSGMMQSGIAYRLDTLVPRTSGKDYSLLPTPSGVNGGKNHTVGRLDEWGGSSNPFRGTDIGKMRCASFEEWMMGLPIGFTELTPSETPSSRKSPKSSGEQY